ncbi:hypothetical protein SAMN05661091_4866 [Paenibacillus uliginis N3/975]|uniref:Peptidase C14 n=1 Tax=Paenibacillus uliginis N3/975 TaxID=1313296 RepID=A0A1X7HQC6_9BACL|nr:hypothetical protein [Paenibacillus uliginis]SMF90032.1 hypothetical protein SAMN05661091_4866 [Paenibacillus uliginis N3/975]
MNHEECSSNSSLAVSRRKALQVLGAAGAVVVGSVLGSKLTFADEVQSQSQSAEAQGGQTKVEFVSDVKALLAINPKRLKADAIVYVAGYYKAGDGGGKWVRWAADSNKEDNGGTVHAARGLGSGRWETIHNGVADFRWFGIFDAQTNADDALAAMVNDLSIHRVEAHTPLNFVRRHVFHRSGIELDFGGHRVTTDGIELNTRDNPFGAVMFFQGQAAGAASSITLSADIPEGSDVLEVQNSSAFAVEDWWIAQVSPQKGGKAQRELDYMVKVTEIIDATHIRINYKLGWSLEAGRTITYTKMNPVYRCSVRNMEFVGVPVPPTESTSQRPFETWDQIGSNPVAYEFAVECDVSGVRATKVFWPVVQRRYCSHYVTESCELINPEERDWGGTGYLTQQLNVLYGNVRNCNTSNARHLNDFTCAAYCLVENCHGDGDDYGPFVTHGQFEHDLTYIGNSGLLSFANSGTHWGDSAKRITVKKHIATRIVAHKKLTDLTLEDCYAINKPGLSNSGSIWANVDGLQIRGCTAENMITLSQSSVRSKRPNAIENCSFGMLKGYEIARPIRSEAVGVTPVSSDLLIANCEFTSVEDVNIGSINRLTIRDTWFRGTSASTGIVRVGSKEVMISGGGLDNCGLIFTGAWDHIKTGTMDQCLTVDGGAVFKGTSGENAYVKHEAAGGTFTLHYGSCQSLADDARTLHFQMTDGKLNFKAVGAHFKGGQYAASEGSIAKGNYFFLTSCIEEKVNRSSLPAEGASVQHSTGNLIIG